MDGLLKDSKGSQIRKDISATTPALGLSSTMSASQHLVQSGSAAAARLPPDFGDLGASNALSPQRTPDVVNSGRGSVAFVERPPISRTHTGSGHSSRRPLSRVHSMAQLARELRTAVRDENDTRAFYGDLTEPALGDGVSGFPSTSSFASTAISPDLHHSVNQRPLTDSVSVPASLGGSRGVSRNTSRAPSRNASFGRLQDAVDADSAALEYLSHSLSNSSTRESSNLLLRTGSRIQMQFHGTNGDWHFDTESILSSRHQSLYTGSSRDSDSEDEPDTVLHAGRYFRPEDEVDVGTSDLTHHCSSASLGLGNGGKSDWEAEARASPLVRLVDWLLGVPCETSAAALNKDNVVSELEEQGRAKTRLDSPAEKEAVIEHRKRRAERERSLWSDPAWLLALGAAIRSLTP